VKGKGLSLRVEGWMGKQPDSSEERWYILGNQVWAIAPHIIWAIAPHIKSGWATF